MAERKRAPERAGHRRQQSRDLVVVQRLGEPLAVREGNEPTQGVVFFDTIVGVGQPPAASHSAAVPQFLQPLSNVRIRAPRPAYEIKRQNLAVGAHNVGFRSDEAHGIRLNAALVGVAPVRAGSGKLNADAVVETFEPERERSRARIVRFALELIARDGIARVAGGRFTPTPLFSRLGNRYAATVGDVIVVVSGGFASKCGHSQT